MEVDEAALLAELRAISNKSASSRFASGNEDQQQQQQQQDEEQVITPDFTPENRSPTGQDDRVDDFDEDAFLPNTEADFRNEGPEDLEDDDILDELLADDDFDDGAEELPSPTTSEPDQFTDFEGDTQEAPEDPPEVIASSQSAATFQGERGGAAQDEELLALLRGVSKHSTAASRFADEDAPEPEPTQPKPDPAALMGGAGNFGQKSKFQGERGGAAEDEELLALLRGVSAKSGAADRFADDNDNAPTPTPAAKEEPKPKQTPKELPPWKRGKAKPQPPMDTDDMIVVASPKKPTPELDETPQPAEATQVDAGNFKQESTFQGERGGAAEDAELLALLRGVSAKSGGVDRFADEADGSVPPAPVRAVQESKPLARKSNELPPWKRGKTPQKQSANDDDDVIVVAARTKAAAPDAPPSEAAITGSGGNFKQESTFSGERGGSAEDEELLALLRGVSARSGAADRFAEEGEASVPAPKPATKPKPAVQKSSRPSDEVPPWKRGKDTSTQPASEAPAPIAKEAVMGGGGTFKQESTFAGERGGAAEDEELLALLRGVSAKSGGADRFAEEGETVTAPAAKNPAPQPKAKASVPEPKTETEASAPVGGKGNFKQASAFKGERGGTAEDEELLALLRGVSSKSGGSSRFAEGEATIAPEPKPVSSPPPQATRAPNTSSMPSPFPTASPAQDEVVVTRENLPQLISDSSWKVRKQSFSLLRSMILEKASGRDPCGDIDGNEVFHGLNEQVSGYLLDKNANALEEALQVGLAFGDYCTAASSPELAESMAVNLIKGNGFTSPRPKAVKAAQALMLKMMEVGEEKASISAIVGMLLEQGLTSKKPKIVQVSASLILETAHSFGAAALPLALIKPQLPKIFTNSNKKIRDVGMELVAEFCRALGGKTVLMDVIEQMKKPQQKELDAMLEKQPQAAKISIGLRCRRIGDGKAGAGAAGNDDLAALQANAAELEAELFANRPAVNLLAEMQKTDYADHLKLAKWSEKVSGLKLILQSGGQTPYKLLPPSSSVNYAPLISDMKGLLPHTHFAVVGKAMEVLSMLAEGVGEKLYPNLRPLVPKLLSLSKDKKLTKGVSSCLDSFFGNVLALEHILDNDSIAEATDESKQKNALARSTALDFLARCVTRGESAGPRARLTASNAKACAKVAAHKLGDSDANVRKAALIVLKNLQKGEDPDSLRAIAGVIAELESSQPRAFKQLASTSKAPPPSKIVVTKRPSGSSTKSKPESGPPTNVAPKRQVPSTASLPSSPVRVTKAPPKTKSRAQPFAGVLSGGGSSEAPSSDEAFEYVESLGIPDWDLAAEDGGILTGIQASKWQHRQHSLNALTEFVQSRVGSQSPESLSMETSCILVFVRDHTKSFKEGNFNINKSIMELFIALSESHETKMCLFPTWAASDGATLATAKVSDKKLTQTSQTLLTSLCLVQEPHFVLDACYKSMSTIKSPIAHEEFLKWMIIFGSDFGVAAMVQGLNDAVDFIIQFCGSKNLKVKKAALTVMGSFHAQLGPAFQAVAFSSLEDQSLQPALEKAFTEHPYDPNMTNAEWPRRSIATSSSPDASAEGGGDGAFQIDVPKLDLLVALPADCIVKMGSREGKTAWKARKAAMEEVENALAKCSGLLDTSRLRPLVDVLRALKERLSDSQSNLKPVAARLTGSLLSKVDATAQGKLGKVVYAPLINSAMNDNRKVMHDACMEALTVATSLASLEGEGPNELALEPFVVALVGELDESDLKSAGISDVLELTMTFTSNLGNLDNVPAQGGNTLGARFAKVLVQGLCSSKAEIRASSEALLTACVTDSVFGIGTVKKSAGRQKPAVQRAIGPIVNKIAAATGTEKTESLLRTQTQVSKTVSNVPSKTQPSRPNQRKSIIPPRSSGVGPPNSTRPRTTATRQPEPRLAEPEIDSGSPLATIITPAAEQRSKAAVRAMSWPEYPEEPSGSLLFSSLKKAWAPLIPSEAASKLFPEKGIKKQDDAMEGFETLSRAISVDKAEESGYVMEQFGFIWKWIVYVLCCKESTVGTQGLLKLLAAVVDHIRNTSHELSDSESTLLVPHLFDKASAAKGRFKDMFLDLMDQLKAEEILPTKRMGPLVCVAVIESSSHPKAKLLACRQCYECVDQIGLAGIGKKGVLAAAKSLSEEKLQENRNALLDLTALLVSRMNGDMQRFARICGSSLSGKARSLLEERIKKGGPAASAPTSKTRSSISRPSPNMKSAVSRRASSGLLQSNKTPSKFPGLNSRASLPAGHAMELGRTDIDGNFKDELPALDLRLGLRSSPPSQSRIPRPSNADLSKPLSSPISPSFQSQLTPPRISASYSSDHSDTGNKRHDEIEEDGSVGKNLFASSAAFRESTERRTDAPSSEAVGAAASLRARLMKIRERNTTTDNEEGGAKQEDEQRTADHVHQDDGRADTHNEGLDSDSYGLVTPEAKLVAYDKEKETVNLRVRRLENYLSVIRGLVSRTVPISDEDDDIIKATDVLKNLHAAVSQQPSLAVGLDSTAVTELRIEIQEKANEVVETLTGLIKFGFNCHEPDCNAGMSVPLLSVDLASLMAIFRSDDLSKTILVEILTVLIRESANALLDPRLANVAPGRGLDEATSTQMVRAINKLAVQAATGATRHYSFEALVSLQQQLCLKADGKDNLVFNSRVGRVVTKLFARVVKAEETSAAPFSPSTVDMEAVVCFLEDALVACREAADEEVAQESISTTQNMARTLIEAILKARGEIQSFLEQMDELEIDSQSSELGKLVAKCAMDLGFSTASHDVAFGETETAEDSISQPVVEQSEETASKASGSMTERIRNLRVRLNATEVVVESASDPVAVSQQPLEKELERPTAKSASTVGGFRDRLAAAQEKRVASNAAQPKVSPRNTESAGSRAAALRARLQAVKRQAQKEF